MKKTIIASAIGAVFMLSAQAVMADGKATYDGACFACHAAYRERVAAVLERVAHVHEDAARNRVALDRGRALLRHEDGAFDGVALDGGRALPPDLDPVIEAAVADRHGRVFPRNDGSR